MERIGRGRPMCAILAVPALAVGSLAIGGCELTKDPEPEFTTTTHRPFSYKPVLYLYPQVSTELEVDLDYAGDVTFAYPRASADVSWKVRAHPDGTLTDTRGRGYPYLFWEGIAPRAYAQDEGFVVAGSEAVPFLQEKLAALGLTDREAADFITFWGPRLAANERNLVTFATEQYSNDARYTFTDASGRAFTPDTFIRVYMVHSAIDAPVDVPEQRLGPAPERTGFVAVEWGGSSQSFQEGL